MLGMYDVYHYFFLRGNCCDISTRNHSSHSPSPNCLCRHFLACKGPFTIAIIREGVEFGRLDVSSSSV